MTDEKDQARQTAGDCFCMGSGPAFSKFAKTLGPPEGAASHFRQARIEFLKGLRGLIDHRIESLGRETGHKGTKITVE